MPHGTPWMLDAGPVQNFRDVAWLWADVNHRGTDRQHVVNLARMNEAQHGVAHYDHMRISGRKRGGKLGQWLVWQT